MLDCASVTMSFSAKGSSCRSCCPEPVDVNKRGKDSIPLLTAQNFQQQLDPELGERFAK